MEGFCVFPDLRRGWRFLRSCAADGRGATRWHPAQRLAIKRSCGRLYANRISLALDGDFTVHKTAFRLASGIGYDFDSQIYRRALQSAELDEARCGAARS